MSPKMPKHPNNKTEFKLITRLTGPTGPIKILHDENMLNTEPAMWQLLQLKQAI